MEVSTFFRHIFWFLSPPPFLTNKHFRKQCPVSVTLAVIGVNQHIFSNSCSWKLCSLRCGIRFPATAAFCRSVFTREGSTTVCSYLRQYKSNASKLPTVCFLRSPIYSSVSTKLDTYTCRTIQWKYSRQKGSQVPFSLSVIGPSTAASSNGMAL